MVLEITIKDQEGGILSQREYTIDDTFELDLRDWNEDKASMIQETLSEE